MLSYSSSYSRMLSCWTESLSLGFYWMVPILARSPFFSSYFYLSLSVLRYFFMNLLFYRFLKVNWTKASSSNLVSIDYKRRRGLLDTFWFYYNSMLRSRTNIILPEARCRSRYFYFFLLPFYSYSFSCAPGASPAPNWPYSIGFPTVRRR